MAARTQALAFGAGAGRRYGSFAGKSAPGPHLVGMLTQAQAFGAGTGRRYGDLSKSTEAFDIEQTNQVGIAGAVAVTGDFEYLQQFNLVQTNQIGVVGTLVANGHFDYTTSWDVAAPIEITPIVGVIGISGDIQIYSSFDLAQTNAIGIAGTIVPAANLSLTINLDPSTIGLAGALSVTGDIGYTPGVPFNIVQNWQIGIAGTLAASGNIQVQTTFDLAQSGALGLAGAMAVSGDIGVETTFDIAQSATLGISGAMSVTGDFEPDIPFDLVQTNVVAMVGALELDGDFMWHIGPPPGVGGGVLIRRRRR